MTPSGTWGPALLHGQGPPGPTSWVLVLRLISAALSLYGPLRGCHGEGQAEVCKESSDPGGGGGSAVWLLS